MTIQQIKYNIGNYIINTDMNITIDKTNKTITIWGEVVWEDLADALEKEGVDSAVEMKKYKLAPPPKEIQYTPVYPVQPIIPQIVPYPVYPYPYNPVPQPNVPYWTITCPVK